MKKYVIFLNQKGLTLIELLAVITILSIIAAISVPSIANIINNQRDKAILSEISSLISTAKVLITDQSCGDDFICEYSALNNEIGFTSVKFTEGEVSFVNGTASSEVIVVVNVDINDFKGRNAADYRALITKTGGFTEKELYDLID